MYTEEKFEDEEDMRDRARSLIKLGQTPDRVCSDGEVACIHGVFAKCDHGKFVQTPCGGGTQCFALPLVNSPGTSVTCTTEGDAAARIQRTGATGGIRGRDLES